MSVEERAPEPTTRPDEPTPAAPPQSRLQLSWPLDRSATLALAAPALIFLGIRSVGLLVLWWLTRYSEETVGSSLYAWDGEWLLAIAGGGYSGVPADLTDRFMVHTPETPLAFFPGYPMTVRLVHLLSGTSVLAAGLAVSLVAGLFLAYGLAALGELLPGGSRRTGLVLVGLAAAAPMGVVWSMTYSEGLFCALAVWALVAVLRRHWVLAGLFAALAGTVRPTAAALLLPVGLALLITALRRQDGWRPWLGGLLAPLGWLGYLVYVAIRVHRPDGWFGVQQRGWNSHFDAGLATLRFAVRTLVTARSLHEVVTLVVLIAAVGLLVLCWHKEVPWPLWLYAAGVLAMDIGSNGLMNSKARLLMPALTLLIPVALGLARRRTSTVVAVLAAAALASAWYGAYALIIWPNAI